MGLMIFFPKNFFWGTATSAHQVEGDNVNSDWWEAEQKGKVPYKSGRACDSYNRYEEDFDLAKQMANNAHRFSIEWARIEPEEGKFDERELKHYYNVLQALHVRGLEPFVTLHHVTNPKWFSDKGGWENKYAPEYFARYIEFIASNLGHEAKYWITINEPELWNIKGYLGGLVPPFHKLDIIGFLRARKNMIKAHKRAYDILHRLDSTDDCSRLILGRPATASEARAGLVAFGDTMPNQPSNPPGAIIRRVHTQVGIAQNLNYLEPGDFLKPVNRLIRRLLIYVGNFVFLDSIKSHQDFIGINYYNHYKVSLWRGKYQDGNERSDFGWEIYPKGLYYVVKENWQRYKKPIFITENGISDADDDQRPGFIKNHLKWLHKTIEEEADVRTYVGSRESHIGKTMEGVADVRGYFYWSLLDNFEWAEGFTQRFGLVEVNFNTFERKMRSSGKLYGQIAQNNGF